MLSPPFWITTGIAIYGCIVLFFIACGRARGGGELIDDLTETNKDRT